MDYYFVIQKCRNKIDILKLQYMSFKLIDYVNNLYEHITRDPESKVIFITKGEPRFIDREKLTFITDINDFLKDFYDQYIKHVVDTPIRKEYAKIIYSNIMNEIRNIKNKKEDNDDENL